MAEPFTCVSDEMLFYSCVKFLITSCIIFCVGKIQMLHASITARNTYHSIVHWFGTPTSKGSLDNCSGKSIICQRWRMTNVYYTALVCVRHFVCLWLAVKIIFFVFWKQCI